MGRRELRLATQNYSVSGLLTELIRQESPVSLSGIRSDKSVKHKHRMSWGQCEMWGYVVTAMKDAASWSVNAVSDGVPLGREIAAGPASTIILGFKSRRAHDHIFLSHDTGSVATHWLAR
jgi:hypothetical protein